MNLRTFLPMLSLALAAAAGAQVITTLADFETGTADNKTSGFWYFVDDNGTGGNSVITSGDTAGLATSWTEKSVAAPGNANSSYAAKLEFTYGDKNPSCTGCGPEVTLGTDIRPSGDSAVDLSTATRLSFFAKATPSLTVSLIFISSDITDYSYFRKPVLITGDWKEYGVALPGALTSPGWGQSAGKRPDMTKAVGFNIYVAKTANPSVTTGTLLIDDVRIHGWAPPGGTSIRVPARTDIARALRASADGKSLRFRVPDAYRETAGAVAAMDISGRVLAKARFVRGQEHVSLRLAQRTSAPVFFRVLAGPGAD